MFDFFKGEKEIITALDIVTMRDFPVACDENGNPVKESIEKAEKERERMTQWALEHDLRMANRR